MVVGGGGGVGWWGGVVGGGGGGGGGWWWGVGVAGVGGAPPCHVWVVGCSPRNSPEFLCKLPAPGSCAKQQHLPRVSAAGPPSSPPPPHAHHHPPPLAPSASRTQTPPVLRRCGAAPRRAAPRCSGLGAPQAGPLPGRGAPPERRLSGLLRALPAVLPRAASLRPLRALLPARRLPLSRESGR